LRVTTCQWGVTGVIIPVCMHVVPITIQRKTNFRNVCCVLLSNQRINNIVLQSPFVFLISYLVFNRTNKKKKLAVTFVDTICKNK